MNEEEARRTAWKILGEFGELLDEKNIVIPSPDRKGVAGEARLYGEEKTRLEKAIVGLLLEQEDVTMTDHDVGDASHPLRQLAIEILDEFEELLAEKDVVIPSDDREGREEEACLYGTEYYELEDAIVDILMEQMGAGQHGRSNPNGPDREAR
jgi:predicted component of viral defense system (DUF524 family)